MATLHLLIYLLPLCLLPGAVAQVGDDFEGSGSEDFAGPRVLDISSCPIAFYGQTYQQMFVSFPDGKFAICFDDYYSSAASDNCILGASFDEPYGQLTIETDVTDIDDIKGSLSRMEGPPKCAVKLSVDDDASYALYSFGRQTGFHFSGISADDGEETIAVQGNGTILELRNLSGDNLTSSFFDLSGCSYAGFVYAPGSEVQDPESCSTLTCGITSEMNVTGCGAMERCRGDNWCVPYRSCSVSGSSIVDFKGTVTEVPDRCAYELISLDSVTNFRVAATFRERRRRDVSFVETVTVTRGGTDIHLGPERRVLLNDTEVLDSSTQLMEGAELSKDDTGITVHILLDDDIYVYIFFDGDSVQIRLEGEDTVMLGLCGDSSAFADSLMTEDSSPGCDAIYVESDNVTIDCGAATERCNLLRAAPFTGCHSFLDPEAFIDACKNTLCSYPSVDGWDCRFLEDYARLCALHVGDALEGWRSSFGCSSHQAACEDRACVQDEFCAQTLGGESACYCRAIYASTLTSLDPFGGVTTCDGSTVSISLASCLLAERGIKLSDLHLNDETCRGQENPETHMIIFSFDGQYTCGAEITANGTHVNYKNTIQLSPSSSNITRHDDVQIEFSCCQSQSDEDSVSFKIKDNSVIHHVAKGAWEYNLTMTAYTDASRSKAVESSTEVQLNQKIWVGLETDGLDENIVAVVVDHCWVTSDPLEDAGQKYDLITEGCANSADPTVELQSNGQGTSSYFSFNMLQFNDDREDVYLHCQVQLCIKESHSCVPSCGGGGRRRRALLSPDEDGTSDLISMAWTS